MLVNDSNGTKVKIKVNSIFPKGTIGKIITCGFVGNTTNRAYCVQTDEDIKGLVKGVKSEWFLGRDLVNILSN